MWHSTKTIIHLSVGESDGYLPRRFALFFMKLVRGNGTNSLLTESLRETILNCNLLNIVNKLSCAPLDKDKGCLLDWDGWLS